MQKLALIGIPFQKEVSELTNINFSNSFRLSILRIYQRMFLLKFSGFCFCFFLAFTAISQEKSLLQGLVLDASTSEPLVGANVFWEGQAPSGTITDSEGRFSLPVLNIPTQLLVSYLGYERSTRLIQVRDLDKLQRFYLKPEDFSLLDYPYSSVKSVVRII
jgi:hypothetical protein